MQNYVYIVLCTANSDDDVIDCGGYCDNADM